jgi:hypothetical protein
MGAEPDSEGWAREGLDPFILLLLLAVRESPLADETYESVIENQAERTKKKKTSVLRSGRQDERQLG